MEVRDLLLRGTDDALVHFELERARILLALALRVELGAEAARVQRHLLGLKQPAEACVLAPLAAREQHAEGAERRRAGGDSDT